MPKKHKIELLSPAGDLERLKTAVRFGADAVYCGLPDWSLRSSREVRFNLKTLKQGIDFAHKYGKKIYLTFNIFPHENQLKKLKKDLLKIKNLLAGRQVDGIIVSDLGVLSLIKKYLPKTPIHLSTQANTVNSEAVKMWVKLGVKRIVLARELTLKEIKEIRKSLGSARDELKLEIFGHGAMCMAYSGRCLLSKYFTGRDANQGDCAQSCRWRYRIKTKSDPSTMLGAKKMKELFFLEEETRPGDLIEVQEDPNGTYFLNSKDICTLDILGKLGDSGVDAIKIEGRAKSIYYIALVTRIYRKAIDALYQGKKIPQELFAELNLISNRGYSHGFLLDKCDYEQNYKTTIVRPPVILIGVVLNNRQSNCRGLIYQTQKGNKDKVNSSNHQFENDFFQVEVKNKFKVGDKIEIITPPSTSFGKAQDKLLGASDGIYKTKILEIKNKKGFLVEEAKTPQDKVWLQLSNDLEIPEGSILRKKQKRHFE